MSLFKLVIVVFCMLNVTTYNNNLLKCLILFKCLQYTVSHKLQIIDDFKRLLRKLRPPKTKT